MAAAEALTRAPLVDQAITRLRREVAAGRWSVGERLPSEPSLAEELGVGRSTVREAVRVLAHAGMLSVRQGSGTYVESQATPDDLSRRWQHSATMEVYEVRLALEVQAAALAAERRSAADMRLISQTLAQRQRARAEWSDTQHRNTQHPDTVPERATAARARFLAADMAFHTAVVQAAHNPLLAELFASASRTIGQAIADVVDERSHPDDANALHEELADAIRTHDAVRAADAVRRHLDGTHQVLARLARR